MNGDFQNALREGAAFLAQTHALWHPRPFTFAKPPWTQRFPELAAYCEGLSDEELLALEQLGPLPKDAPAALVDLQTQIDALQAPFEFQPKAHAPFEVDEAEFGRVSWRVPARKLAQIKAIVGQSAKHLPKPVHILDWCGGKGHLGRTLGAYVRAPVTVLELEPAYEAEALSLGERLKVALRYLPKDALSDEAKAEVLALPAHTLAVGLHACGQLGERLIELTRQHPALSLVHAPCCLHKVAKDGYQPLSKAGAAALEAANLRLDHSALRLATSDEVLARPALKEGRKRENAWRLALDLLLQEASGQAIYQPLGVLPAAWLKEPFEVFARLAAEAKGLTLPAHFEPEVVLAKGRERAALARRYGVIRGRFRRLLELQVVLDRAQALIEAGFRVEVLPFCPPHLSPRNLLIVAQRPEEKGTCLP